MTTLWLRSLGAGATLPRVAAIANGTAVVREVNYPLSLSRVASWDAQLVTIKAPSLGKLPR